MRWTNTIKKFSDFMGWGGVFCLAGYVFLDKSFYFGIAGGALCVLSLLIAWLLDLGMDNS